jgi:hypothetical protein
MWILVYVKNKKDYLLQRRCEEVPLVKGGFRGIFECEAKIAALKNTLTHKNPSKSPP